MAAWKRRSEAKDDNDASRKPSTLFWREDSGNKPRIETIRKKKNPSGGTIDNAVKIQTSTKDLKENRAPTVDKHQRRPSLKDLCPEDKQRVKLLIEQLARTTSEKEAVEDKVREERRQFTLLLDKLKKQHHKVVKEKKELETELHVSQLQLQAIHTYPPSSANDTPQLLTHPHMGSAVVATTTANPLQTPAAVSRRAPAVPSTHAIPSGKLTVVSQAPVMRTPLSTLAAAGVHNSTATLPQYVTESMSSSGTGFPSSIRASYPAYFTASSRNPNQNSINFNNDHIQRASTAYPPPNLMESLSTTSISQGVPLSSTHVQHQECQAGNRPLHVKADPPSSNNAMTIQNGGKCYSREVPIVEHHGTHNTNLEEQQYQVSVPLKGEQEAPADKATTMARTELATPPAPVRQRWLSLPSATPEQCCSPCDKIKKDGTLFLKQDGSLSGSCREIGTQTLCVESIATQTDREEHDNPPTSPEIRGRINVSSSSPTLTKESVDSTAMSVGDLHKTAPSNTDTPQAIVNRYSQEHQNQGNNDDSPHLDQSNSEVLLEELLTASLLLNGQGAVAGGQTESQGYSSTSKEAELLRLESISPFELAASLNSHRGPSPSPQPSFSLTFKQHSHLCKDPNPPFSYHQHEHSLPSCSVTRSSTTATSENSPPRYTNYPYYYRDWDRDTTRQGWSLDDSKLIEELFFI